ncbi:MAG TPA: hypothetical protein PKD12_20955 [Nitrospira sp.]|nr:hypothetical protein [Nitrospira sp.]
MRPSTSYKVFLLTLCLVFSGCVHRIHVTPLPPSVSSNTIPRSLQTVISPIVMEGPDHRPGITHLDWPHEDLTQGTINYLRHRGTFASISLESSDLVIHVATKLMLRSRRGLYHYRIILEAEMREASHPIKTYHVEQTAVGSAIRWVTVSDRRPIEIALQLALEDLLGKIEADRSLYLNHRM